MSQSAGERLKIALGKLNMEYQEFADKFEDISIHQVRHMTAKKKPKIITPDLAMSIEEKTGISAAYILLGRGDIFDKQPSALSVAMGDTSTSRIQVPYYEDIKACAGVNGYTNDEMSEVSVISMPVAMLDNNVKAEKIEAIKVHGDSMEPTINDNDIIFICKKSMDIIDGKIYVLVYNDEVYVKRVFKRKESIIIKSDNPIYPQDEIAAQEARIVGRVIYNFTPLGI